MKKIKDIRRQHADKYVQVVGKKTRIPLFDVDRITFSTKINLVSGTYINPEDMGYVDMRLKTIADLLYDGEMVSGSYIKRHKILLNIKDCRLTEKQIEDVIWEFYRNGFIVSKRAIKHNFRQWLGCCDAGYRSSKCHLRSYADPEYSTLIFEATSFSIYCSLWQKTYPKYNFKLLR